MRLYLSSFRLGNRTADLARLVGSGRRVGIVANALDGDDVRTRAAAVELEVAALASLGYVPEEVDLRDHVGDEAAVEARLRELDLLWLRGGNVFMLRYALHRSGADEAIRRLLAADAVAYGGYSAAACVLGPTLEGFERTDDPAVVERAYGEPAVTSGLRVLDFVVVPHVDSPEHPASAALTELADDYERSGVTVHRLRDGEVLVVG